MKNIKKFNYKGNKYLFKYVEDTNEHTGNYLVELCHDDLNKYTPKHFIIIYNDQKVSFKAVNPEDFDIKCAVIKAILCSEEK